jgi:uncharacterized protein (DUF2461 family)
VPTPKYNTRKPIVSKYIEKGCFRLNIVLNNCFAGMTLFFSKSVKAQMGKAIHAKKNNT